jgi:tetratricopeptide (TPR) repeat protein
MAKNQRSPKATSTPGRHTGAATVMSPPQPAVKQLPLLNLRLQIIILALTCLIFYANTFTHENAFDDRMAIAGNEYVLHGVSGIPDILTHDAYQSYLEQRNGGNQLAGGRYRPLSLITFAVEQQFMGTLDDSTDSNKEAIIAQQMHARHVINVLLYILSAIALLYLFRNIIFPGQPLIAFLTVFLFVIHPIHTEVVANVKSRDEILSVLFISLTFINAFRYFESKKRKHLISALVCYFLALLSKEYAILLLALLPLSFYLFRKDTLRASLKQVLPYTIPFAVYMLMRMAATGEIAEGAENTVMNNPYMLATASQKLATEFWVMLRYLQLLFIPHPLVADYSYRQIPYTDFSNALVWISLVIHIAMIAAIPVLFRRRHPLCFAVAIYLLNLLLVSNIFFNIGAPMGERLVYHSSIGFAMVIAYGLYMALAKARVDTNTPVLVAVLLVLMIPSAYATISRNNDWKNDVTLFLADVKKAPNSVLVNNNAAAAYMALAKKSPDTAVRNEYFRKAIGHFDKTLSIYPKHLLARLNRGLSYFNMQMPDKAYPDWDTVRTLNPSQPNVNKYLSILAKYYQNEGGKYDKEGKHDATIVMLQKAVAANPSDPNIRVMLAYAQLSAGHKAEAKLLLEKILQQNPQNEQARRLFEQASAAGGN